MECQLKLSRAHHELVLKRKTAIQKRFKVQIDSPCSFGDGPYDWIYKGFGRNDIFFLSAKGKVADVEALEKYVKEAVVRPEIIEIVSYTSDLKPIFDDPTWIEIFEESYNVCISTKPECELNISGAESSVSSAAAAIEEVKIKYDECKDTPHINGEKSLVHRLAHALKVCRGVSVSVNTFDRIPDAVITLLLSLLQKVCAEDLPVFDYSTSLEDLPVFDDSTSLEDCVLILDTPKEKADISVIVLDSDTDDNSSSSKRSTENCSDSDSHRKKPKKLPNAKRKLKNLQKKKNGIFQGCSSQNSHQNGLLQIPKVENTNNKSKLPVIENSNFIPLRLKSAGNSAAGVSTNQVNHQTAEVAAQPAEPPKVIPPVPKRLRPVIIDGSNVAFYSQHDSSRKSFSWNRIQISIAHFLQRGHTDVTVILPQLRRAVCYEKAGSEDLVKSLEAQQLIVFTPSRRIDGRMICCYDDRFIVDLAFRKGGVILSNDNYRDLMEENKDWAETIKKRLLMYVFVDDELMIPEDPLGAKGPRLNDFLAFPDD